MLDIKLIREDPVGVKQKLAARNVDGEAIDEILKLDEQWRARQTTAEQMQEIGRVSCRERVY